MVYQVILRFEVKGEILLPKLCVIVAFQEKRLSFISIEVSIGNRFQSIIAS